MNKLALSDEILGQVEKPARYIGREVNAVYKDPEKIRVRFAMCFPDVYEIGMSHLGIQIIYEQLNRKDDIWCERVYSPWPDLADILKEKKIPLFALESQDPIREFDFLGITLQYELCYTNVLQVLDLSGIPMHACDRTEEDPIVVGGGPCSYNPEPIADFFDMFYIGESETVMTDLTDLYAEMKENGASRREFLKAAAQIPGIYVPQFYRPSYHEDGTLASFEPVEEGVPATVRRQICMDLDKAPYPEHPITPYIRPVQDRVVLEIQRGCIRGCRFCQAGIVYRPLRERSPETLKRYAESMLKSTGYEEISLSSLSSSDYRYLQDLLTHLIDTYQKEHVNISLPSLRIDNFSLDVMNKVQDIRKSSLTFAPEAGTQRLRDVINKGLSEEEILGGAKLAFQGGWNKVKLYFMLGLPTETDDDRRGIAHLAQKICETYFDEVPKEKRNGSVDVTVSTSFLVPKPFTPFQWATMSEPSQYIDYAHTVRDEVRQMLNQKRIHYKWHEADGTELEGLLARGDRKVAEVIEYAYRHGAIFDSWTDYFHYDIWKEAYEACGMDVGFYTRRERPLDELFPWDFIDVAVSKDFLRREWIKAVGEGGITANCRARCSACGARAAGGGVCFENRDLENAAYVGKQSLGDASTAQEV
ncbi:MAG: TIGR03960 family B12-binding radical SAM protein [Lachnospiraceae bacterium]|nr:TIGR03960 family B12-binding radical SAM protein [Lachnospiraceae bacterium]